MNGISGVYNYNMQYQSVHNVLPNSTHFQVTTAENHDETKNRFVYVNQNYIPRGSAANCKVLINPNFKPTVHINPNFKKSIKPSIHVNPNIIKIPDKTLPSEPIRSSGYNTKPENVAIEKPNPLIATRTKLVRIHSVQKKVVPAKEERRKSIYSKYKIVHSHNTPEKLKVNDTYLKNRYKIDKNIRAKEVLRKRNTSYKNNSCSTFTNNIGAKKYVKRANTKYISINGTLYRKTPNVLRKSDLLRITRGDVNTSKNKILLIRGCLYKLDHHQKSLKLLSVNKSFSQKVSGKGEGTKSELLNKSLKLNKSKNKSKLCGKKLFGGNIIYNKMRKCNLPCPIYRKFGKCKANELGKCFRVHNPDQVMLCTRFLQGDCFNPKCLLSHKVSAEKMPTCKYYLEGRCTKEDCVYLHVKISAKADICRDFLAGYCKEAKDCVKRHQFLCPDFEKSGSCPRKRCQYPHGNAVRNKKSSSKVAKKIVKSKRIQVPVKSKTEGETAPLDKNVRYYIDTCGEKVRTIKNLESYEDSDHARENSVTGASQKLSKRPQLGTLPAYIPFGEAALLLHKIT